MRVSAFSGTAGRSREQMKRTTLPHVDSDPHTTSPRLRRVAESKATAEVTEQFDE